jgi:hypothetical protein
MNTTKTMNAPTMDFPFEAKQINEDLGTFEGYAST